MLCAFIDNAAFNNAECRNNMEYIHRELDEWYDVWITGDMKTAGGMNDAWPRGHAGTQETDDCSRT
jgi:hypothetical protein